MRLISIFILFFCFCFTVKSQQLFYQNTFRGGITANGISYASQEYLNSDTINLGNLIPNGATIKKATLFMLRSTYVTNDLYKKDYSITLKLNNIDLTIDSNNVLPGIFGFSTTAPNHYGQLVAKDVTNIATYTNNTIILPNQAQLMLNNPERNLIYLNPYLAIVYEQSNLPVVNSVFYIYNKTGRNSTTEILSNLNPINTNYDVGLAFYTANTNLKNSPLNYSIQSPNNIILLGGLTQEVSSLDSKFCQGSFDYINNTLTGIGHSTPNPFVDSIDALANIQTYINNNSNNIVLYSETTVGAGILNNTLGYVLAYTTPCPARGFNDTLVKYTICEGQSVILNTQSIGNTYSWYPKRSLNDSTLATPIATPTITTNYIVSIDSAGCKHTEQVQVAVITKPTIDTIITTNDVCGGPQGKITVNIKHSSTEPYSYSINGEPYINNNVFNNLSAGDYTISISNNAGCISDNFTATVNSSLEVNTIFSSQTATSNYIAPLSIYFSNSTTGANNYNWYINNVFESSALNYFHTFTDSGIYSIMLIAYNNIPTCADTAYLNITVLPQDTSGVFIPNVFSPNGDGINDMFDIKYEHAEEISMTIYDRWGNEVFIKELKNVNTGIISWNGKNASGTECSAGTYFYIVNIKVDKKYSKPKNKEYKGFLSLLR